MKHEGKILIQVDEKDERRVIAKNLLTGETAVAKCSPDDTWDFRKGAELALKCLMEPKYWTGKVVCLKDDNSGRRLFTAGKVYSVVNGVLNTNIHYVTYANNFLIVSVDDLNKKMKGLPDWMISSEFIEYKGGAEK